MPDPDTAPGRSEIDLLRERVDRLEEQVAALRRTTTPAPEAPEHRMAGAPVGRPAPLAPPPLAGSPTSAAPLGPRTQRKEPNPPPRFGSRSETSTQDLETFLGGRVLLVAGVILVLIGIAYFLRWAIVTGLLGPAGRVTLAIVAGIAALFAGDRLRARGFDVFGQSLMGGGLGSLYLAVYFSAVHYGFIDRPVALVASALLTAIGAVFSILRNAPFLAHLGFAGGYLAPALLGSDLDAIGMTTGWLVMLHFGVLGVALRKPVFGIELQAAVATVAYWSNWRDRWFTPERLPTANWTLLVLAGALFVLGAAPAILRARKPPLAAMFAAFVANLFLMIAGSSLWLDGHRTLFGIALVGLAAANLTAGRLIAWNAANSAAEAAGFLVLALVGTAGAIYQLTDGLDRPVAFAVVSAVLVLVGKRRNWPVFPQGAVVLALIGTFHGFEHTVFVRAGQPHPFFNLEFFAAAAPIAALFAETWMLGRGRTAPRDALGALAEVAASLAVVVLAASQNLEFGRSGHPLGVAPLFVITGAAAAFAGATLRRSLLRDGGIGLFLVGAVVAGMRSADASRLATLPFVNTTFWSSMTPAAALLACALLLRDRAARAAAGVCFTAGLLAILFVVSAEIYAWGRTGHPFAAQVWVSVAWTVYAATLIAVGFARRVDSLRWAGLAMFGLTLVKVFLVDTATIELAYRIGSFLVLGVLAVLASFLYQQARR